MRSFVVLFGLLLTNTGFAADCRQPSVPGFPGDGPITERVEKKLSREVARYMEDSGRYIACLRAEAVNPATVAQKENEALHAVIGLIDLYETRIGHSDRLIVEIAGLKGPVDRENLDRRIAAAQERAENDAIQTLNAAIAHINARRFGEARATVGELDLESLNAFERSKAEQVLYTIAYGEENFEEARGHVEKALDAGGLSPGDQFKARLALTDIDVMLRIRGDTFADTLSQPVE